MGKIRLRSAWTLRMYRPRGPYGPRLRGRHKSPGIAANNMRVKFISPVDSYVTALLCVCFSMGPPEKEEKGERGGRGHPVRRRLHENTLGD